MFSLLLHDAYFSLFECKIKRNFVRFFFEKHISRFSTAPVFAYFSQWVVCHTHSEVN